MTYSIKGIQAKSLLGQYAGFISRLMGFIIDTFIISIVLVFSTWFISITMQMLQIKPFINLLITKSPGIIPYINLLLSPVTAGIIVCIFIVFYHIFFWSFAGQTPGKALMGIRVVPLRGRKISLWRATLRFLGYFLSGIALGGGFLWIIIDDRRMAWHDKLAGTCVVYVWDARPDEKFLVSAMQGLSMRRDALSYYITQRKIRNQGRKLEDRGDRR